MVRNLAFIRTEFLPVFLFCGSPRHFLVGVPMRPDHCLLFGPAELCEGFARKSPVGNGLARIVSSPQTLGTVLARILKRFWLADQGQQSTSAPASSGAKPSSGMPAFHSGQRTRAGSPPTATRSAPFSPRTNEKTSVANISNVGPLWKPKQAAAGIFFLPGLVHG